MINEQIKILRNKNQLTQEGLAEKLNISRQTISKWEKGISEPDTGMIIELLEYFSVSTDYLLKGTKYIDNNQPQQHNINFWTFLNKKWWLVIIILLIICGTVSQIFAN